MKKQRGFAFSQSEEGGQDKIMRMYDTTLKRGAHGELVDAQKNPFSDTPIDNHQEQNFDVAESLDPTNPFKDPLI